MTIDTTGSTPLPVDENARPLSFRPEFEHEVNALCFMWKDRSSYAEAEELSRMLSYSGANTDSGYLDFTGGAYSPEWYWAKVRHAERQSPHVALAAATWTEHCDWLTAEITGVSDFRHIVRSRCGAAHKALWNTEFGGFPEPGVFASISPYLEKVRRSLPAETHTSDVIAGSISREWAERLGVPLSTRIGVGLFDSHAGAIGAGIRYGRIVKSIGTSSADIVVVPRDELRRYPVPGVESQAEGSVLPGFIGIEAGQAAFGDLLAWFADMLCFESKRTSTRDNGAPTHRILERLEQAAKQRKIGEHSVVGIDWFNGRRAPFSNASASGLLSGLSLGTDAVDVYAALVQSLAFGTRSIHEHLRRHGVRIDTICAVGGIPKTSPYIMQILSDVLGCPIEVAASEQSGARGAAILASVAAGKYPSVTAAIEHLKSPVSCTYRPRRDVSDSMTGLYARYLELGRTIDPSFDLVPQS